eukprot:15367151-Ditylum_brightwellii.AAC.2
MSAVGVATSPGYCIKLPLTVRQLLFRWRYPQRCTQGHQHPQKCTWCHQPHIPSFDSMEVIRLSLLGLFMYKHVCTMWCKWSGIEVEGTIKLGIGI